MKTVLNTLFACLFPFSGGFIAVDPFEQKGWSPFLALYLDQQAFGRIALAVVFRLSVLLENRFWRYGENLVMFRMN
ncbi:hypothetical protein [methane-oxidizing endosymbiont of Gigantopelta aegis]|uniref:hypothetical protein n=1 Tax=methane-oxidizing endosymbiont of Gigantopelta aegis TaxID=2794938 RepID=UPI001BE460B6|nr:hypothetical protein [methane-oxidizing endosymbiont of Gigantopelta aegis]